MNQVKRKTQPSPYQVEYQTIIDYIQQHWDWSLRTFGPGNHTEGLLKHIEKEMEEIRKTPSDLVEWIDIAILALDGACREADAQGYTLEQVASTLIEKQNINKLREWPKMVEGQPTEHIRENPNGQKPDI